MSVPVVVPEKLREARGLRTIDTIIKAAAEAGYKFTKGAYSQWENGKKRPTDENKMALVKALGVKFEQISLPIDKVPADSKFFAR